MNKYIGIALILIGIISGIYAFSQHEDEKTLVEIGDLKIKNGNQKAGKNTQMYYIIAAAGIVGGGFFFFSRNNSR